MFAKDWGDGLRMNFRLDFCTGWLTFTQMKASVCLILATGLLAGCGDDSGTTATPATNAPKAAHFTNSGNPLSAPADYLGAVANAQQKAIKNIDLAQVKEAINMFNAGEGRFPKDLNELVETKYLGVIPKAPYGMKITYDAATGKVKVVDQ